MDVNLQHLLVVHEIAKRGFSLREASIALRSSPNNVRQHIRNFENELGFPLFDRRGKSIKGLTAGGSDLMEVIERIQGNLQKLRILQDSPLKAQRRTLRIGATANEARYVLPHILRGLKLLAPRLPLQLHMGSPAEMRALAAASELDLLLGQDVRGPTPDFCVLRVWDWPLTLLVSDRHPLVQMEKVTLEALAIFPLVTWHEGMQGRAMIDGAFASRDLKADVVLAAASDDIIVTYVEAGLGVGILAPMSERKEQGLISIDVSHLFGRVTSGLLMRRGHSLMKNVYEILAGLDQKSSAS